ncbi:MAG: hypothetical protein IT530_17950 [Burkholderiales bacterium]|nr:hypothetical protein [Burkholderiales bacterium]
MDEGNLDARLRTLFTAADTLPGFEARIMTRVRTLHAGPDAKLLALAERRRAATRQQLRRDTWMNVVSAAGIGAALIALAWHAGPLVGQWVDRSLIAAADPGTLAGISFVALGLGAWITLQRLLPQ